jgi:predicted nucleic-acid-binding protein
VKALDTNILVRYYAQDDPRQAKIALRLLSKEPELFVPASVAIELYLVLRHTAPYRFPAGKVLEVLRHLIALPNVMIENYDVLSTAIHYCAAGIEFPDAVHLAASARCSELLTFDDRRFARRARRAGLKPAVNIPAA